MTNQKALEKAVNQAKQERVTKLTSTLVKRKYTTDEIVQALKELEKKKESK